LKLDGKHAITRSRFGGFLTVGENVLARGGPGSTVAERYAGAFFELAREKNSVESIERSLDTFLGLLRESADLRRFVLSPMFSSAEQQQGLSAVLKSAGIDGLPRDFLLVLARNRRLFAVENVIEAYKSLSAKDRGEVEAEVISAVPLTTAQAQDLTDTLRQKLGKTPKLVQTVDPKLLGGLIVRVGSQMIDTSLRTKLKNLEKVMKEAS
jgi:F-type H+-transporting ATPase subunit delta